MTPPVIILFAVIMSWLTYLINPNIGIPNFVAFTFWVIIGIAIDVVSILWMVFSGQCGARGGKRRRKYR